MIGTIRCILLITVSLANDFDEEMETSFFRPGSGSSVSYHVVYDNNFFELEEIDYGFLNGFLVNVSPLQNLFHLRLS
jgi:hypothetical protein